MRRWALPVALVAVTAAASAAALRPVDARSPSPSRPAVRAAVLSPRRVPTVLSGAIAAARLGARLERVLADADLGRGRQDSCLVVSHGGTVVFDRDGDRQLTPASTLKLLTATVVAREMSLDSRFRTRVVATRAAEAGVVSGDVWLVGFGDPLLGTAGYAASFDDQPRKFTDIAQLADSIAGSGLRRIEGRVLGDESKYDTERYRPSWRPGFTASGNVGALSALAVDDGFEAWDPRHVAAPAPARHAARVLTDLLEARGVEVVGAPGEGRAPPSPVELGSVASLPLGEILGEMLIHSDNDTAELLTKELSVESGGAGTTAAGVTVMRRSLADLGVDVSRVVTTDGSGLDGGDKATCAVLHDVLRLGAFEPLRAGLAVAGRTGTMFDQFENNPAAGRLRAKTGALEGVVGLAGLVDAPEGGDGVPLTFAFLANSLPGPSHDRGERIQEKLGAALASYPEAPAPASLAP